MPAPVPQPSGGRPRAPRRRWAARPRPCGTWPRRRSDSSPGPAPRPAPARRAPAVPSPPAAACWHRRSCRYGAGTGAAPSWDPPQFKGPVGHAVLPLRMPHDGAADARQPGSAGCGKCSGSTGSWRSSSSNSIIRRPSRVPGCQSSGTSVAAAISSRSSDRQHAALRGTRPRPARQHRAHARLAAHADAVPPRPAPTRRAWAAPRCPPRSPPPSRPRSRRAAARGDDDGGARDGRPRSPPPVRPRAARGFVGNRSRFGVRGWLRRTYHRYPFPFT